MDAKLWAVATKIIEEKQLIVDDQSVSADVKLTTLS